MKNNDLLNELKERGIIEYTAESEKGNLDNFFDIKNRNKKAAYIGADPSAKSLHLGNYATYIVLKWLKKANYQIYAIIGGITGIVGDPRDPIYSGGDAKERDVANIKAIENNVKSITKQYKTIFKVSNIVNNISFYKNMSVWEYLREIGKRINVNYILNKDVVSRRLSTGISYAEFSYNLLQGWDWTVMYFDGMEEKKYVSHQMLCQFGGADQWGNITTGLEFIRKKCSEKNLPNKACCFGVKLYLKPDGTKFGKSASGAIWLDETMTSNYEFYQYLYNQPDDAMKSLLYRFTLIERKVIDEIIDKHSKKPYERLAQKTLADTVTIDVRGKKALEEANQIREILFHGGLEKAPLFMMKKVIKEISNKVFLKEEQSISLIDVLVNSSICESKSQARKLIEQKSISYNGETISDINFTFSKKKVVEFIKKGNKTYIILDWLN